MTNSALKIQTFTTDPGFTPHDGIESADFRGDNWVGHPQGDEQ